MPTAPLRVLPSRALLAALCLLIGCAHPAALPPAPKPASPPPAATLAQVEEAVFAAAFASSPSFATAMGVHTYDDRLDDVSRAHFEARSRELEGLLARLSAVDRAGLSLDEQVDAEALEAQLRAELYELATLRTWEKNPMLYAGLPGGAVDGLIKRDFAPKAERLRSVIARLRQVPRVYAAGKANVQTPAREFTDLALRMSRGSVGFFERAVARWAEDAAGGDAALLAEFRDANAQASPRRRTSRRGSSRTCCRARRAATRSAPSASSRS